MELSNLRPAEGSKHSDNFRRGRGHGSGNGKTAGKGHKGQLARSGHKKPGFEGGHAVIIQGNKIACAAAYFPPTTKDLPSKYGARHRAAVGISEITDSITIIVSEETGNISVAVNGQLTQYPPEGLQRYLTNMLVQSSNQNSSSILVPMLNQAKSMSKRAKKQEEDINKDERVKAIEIVNLIEQKKEGSQHGISK